MSQFLELPDTVFAALQNAAKADGTNPADWVAARLQARHDTNGARSARTAEEIAHANARLRQHVVDLGAAVGCDNNQIDADLAREFGGALSDSHRPA